MDTIRKVRVVWDGHEIRQLAEKMVGAIINNPGEGLVTLLDGLQHMMPPERRRHLQSIKQCPELYRLIKEKLKELKDRAGKVETVETIYLETPPEEIIQLMPLHQLISRTMLRMAEEITELRIQQNELRRVINQQPINRDSAKKQIKIGIVGLLPGVFDNVKAHFVDNNQSVELVYVDKDRAKPEFPSCDYIILAIKFIKHHWCWVADREYGPKRSRKVHGGAESIILAIKDIINKNQ